MSELGELTYRRIYNASPEVMYECLTTPEHLTHFWGPIGMSTPLDQIVVELHVGGRFETTMVHDESGQSFTSAGVYVELIPGKKIVFSEPGVEGGMTTSMEFIDLGDGRTEAITHQTNVPEMYRTPESQAGMQTAFDKMDAYLETLAA